MSLGGVDHLGTERGRSSEPTRLLLNAKSPPISAPRGALVVRLRGAFGVARSSVTRLSRTERAPHTAALHGSRPNSCGLEGIPANTSRKVSLCEHCSQPFPTTENLGSGSSEKARDHSTAWGSSQHGGLTLPSRRVHECGCGPSWVKTHPDHGCPARKRHSHLWVVFA